MATRRYSRNLIFYRCSLHFVRPIISQTVVPPKVYDAYQRLGSRWSKIDLDFSHSPPLIFTGGGGWKVRTSASVFEFNSPSFHNRATHLKSITNSVSDDDRPMYCTHLVQFSSLTPEKGGYTFTPKKFAPGKFVTQPRVTRFLRNSIRWCSSALWLKQRKISGTDGFKWQCSANCHIFYLLFRSFILITRIAVHVNGCNWWFLDTCLYTDTPVRSTHLCSFTCYDSPLLTAAGYNVKSNK